MVNGKKFPYTDQGMMDAAAAKKKSGSSRPDTGGSAQMKRDLKTNKSANKGKGPLYEAGNSKEDLARQARKFALEQYGMKSKQYKRTMPKDDSIMKRKGM
jgi:hypothetical protein